MKRLIKPGLLLLPFLLLCTAAQASSYTATRYPVVLVHGLFGFDSVAGVVDYWNGIPEALEDGGANIYVTQVPAVNSNVVRGEGLLVQVQQILAITGAEKVNLIGHSQGGQTMRYVSGVRPDLVASATSVGTPHRGTPVADLTTGIVDANFFKRAVLEKVVNGFGGLIDLFSGGGFDQDAYAALAALNSKGAARFNARYTPAAVPAGCGDGAFSVEGVRYYSWSGTSPLTNALDPSDGLLVLTSLAFRGRENDGLVGRCSSHLGEVIRDDYRMNHLDQVNQLFGLTAWFATDPVSVFRQQANRLQNAGF